LGHKVHPTGFRLGVIRDWQSKWYSDTHYAEFVQEDTKLRETIKSKYPEAAISLVEIDRQAKDVTLTLYTARPGIVIGRGGQRVDEMRLYLESLIGKRIRLNIQEIRQPELDAYLVARAVAEQIERRVAYRRAIKQAIFRTIQAGAKGIKISCAGRLGNAEIARRQTSHQGQVPLHTLRADIDYGFTEARTTLGRIGVKVWIYKGQILPEPKVMAVEEEPAEAAATEITEAAPEEKPSEAVAEITEAAPEEEPAKPRAKRATKEAASAEPEEKPAEAVAEITEVAPVAESEEKPTKPRAKRATKAAASAEPEEKPAEAATEITEATPAAAPEEEPAKPRAKRATKEAASAEPEEKPAEAVTEITEAAPAAAPEEEPAKPRAKRATKEADTTIEKQEKEEDAAA